MLLENLLLQIVFEEEISKFSCSSKAVDITALYVVKSLKIVSALIITNFLLIKILPENFFRVVSKCLSYSQISANKDVTK